MKYCASALLVVLAERGGSGGRPSRPGRIRTPAQSRPRQPGVLKRGSTQWLAINWGGAEGSALSLWHAEDSDQFTQVIGDSWYQSPL